MDVVGVRVELPANTPIILLKESDGTRYLPIWIGPAEARAIAYGMQGIVQERPLTHDLIMILLAELDAVVTGVTIVELSDRTFYADLDIEVDGDERTVSARPSDAVAIAVRSSAPVWCESEVLDEAGVEITTEEGSADDSESEVQRFREFLDQISPEDFAP